MSEESRGGGNDGGRSFPWSEFDRAKSQAITRKNRIAELERQLGEVTTERDTLKTTNATLTTERDDYKAKFETLPNALRDENAKLVGQIREREHKDAISGLIGDPKSGLKLRPDAVDALLKVAGYDPTAHSTDDGKPDVEKIKATLGEAVKAAPWAVQSEVSDGKPQPGPAGGRGAPAPRVNDESDQGDEYGDGRL
jgi:hypothetical protein